MRTIKSGRRLRILLTGERGVGNTTACERAVGILKRNHVRCGGILTRKILHEEGSIRGIRVLDILPEPPRECLLARTDKDLGGPAVGLIDSPQRDCVSGMKPFKGGEVRERLGRRDLVCLEMSLRNRDDAAERLAELVLCV